MQHDGGGTSTMSVEPPPPLRVQPQRLVECSPPPPRSPQCSEELNSPRAGHSESSSSSPSPHTTVSLATTVSVTSDLAPSVSAPWWHPHVYARPPKRPTPHFIADILGMQQQQQQQSGQEQPLNLTTKTRVEKVPPVVLAQPNPIRRHFREPPLVNGHRVKLEPGLPKPASEIKGE